MLSYFRNLIFFGTSDFAVPILEKMVRSGMRPILVVTTPDAPRGRKQILSPPPVKIKAQELGLELIQPKTLKDQEVISRIASYKPEVGVLAAYGKIIPKALIDVFPKGILNIHPSLLPRWRGPTPIQAALLAGDEKTGVTIILLDEEVDHGPILAQRELPITNYQLPKIDYTTLHNLLAEMGADLLIETLPKWLSGELSPTPQDHSRATFCKKFTFEDGKIDWTKSAEEIDRMIRALNPEPGTYTRFKDKNEKVKILKILAAQPFANSRELENKKVGEIFEHNGNPVVKCGKGALVLERVQPEGKKSMSGEEFLRGHTYLLN
jgi:methionyl-tRNA formyltransferase